MANVKEYSSLTWVRMELLRVFEKRVSSGRFLYVLSIVAPSFVILTAIGFLLIAVWTDNLLLSAMIDRMDVITDALKNVVVDYVGG